MLWELSGICHTGRKGFQGKVGVGVGSGASVNMWLVCDMEVAELGSRRLCRMGRGLLKEEGMGLWCARSWGR